jgi:chromate transporter
MHRVVVDEKRWIGEQRFLHALNFCMLLPGPEAMQLATYIGWLMHRARGALVAGLLFIFPGFVSIMVLSILYAMHEESIVVELLFYGVKPAVLAIVLHALLRIGSRSLPNRAMHAIAACSFFAIFFLDVPFPLIILGAGIVGLVGSGRWPHLFHSGGKHGGSGKSGTTPCLSLPTMPSCRSRGPRFVSRGSWQCGSPSGSFLSSPRIWRSDQRARCSSRGSSSPKHLS